jgi:hypothetical protein
MKKVSVRCGDGLENDVIASADLCERELAVLHFPVELRKSSHLA